MKLPKILSESEKQAKETRRNRLMTAIIVIILMASTAAFALTSDKTEKMKYNGFSFIKTDSGWNVKDTNLITAFLPKDVENLSSPEISPEDFKKNVFYIAMTNAEQAAANELNRAFYSHIEKAQLACSEKYADESFCTELPVKDCENNTETNELIIEIEETENSSIAYENGCISIKGNEADLLRASDKIIFSAYGIIR